MSDPSGVSQVTDGNHILSDENMGGVFISDVIVHCHICNSQGHAQDRLKVIDDLVQCDDFVLIQEHWYLGTQLSDNITQTHFDNVCSHSVSGLRVVIF